jgi:hypothetical protein
MSKVRVHNFAVSLDGYAAGPNQNVDNPLVGGQSALPPPRVRAQPPTTPVRRSPCWAGHIPFRS